MSLFIWTRHFDLGALELHSSESLSCMDVRSLWILDSIIAFWEGWRLHCYASLCWFLLAWSLCAVWWIVDIGFSWDPVKARLQIGHVCRVPEFNRSCLWHHGHDRWLWRCWVDTWLTLQHVIPKIWGDVQIMLTWHGVDPILGSGQVGLH